MLWLLACSDRPEGEFEYFDSPHGHVRVHFTREGDDAIDPADDDGNGLPDRAEEGADGAERALETYTSLGWPTPIGDGDAGGGEDVLDVYFAGLEPGVQLGLTRCPGSRAGAHGACHVRLSSTLLDVRMLAAHEVFHVVQNSYSAPSDYWFEESGAAWMAAEVSGEAYARDGWLHDHALALEEIEPANDDYGAAYGLALWWEFLDAEGLDGVHRRTWEILAEVGGTPEEALDAALREDGASLATEWPTFANWGLNVGDLAGYSEGFFFQAATLHDPPLDAEGETLRLTVDVEPLSVRYYRVDHGGGGLWLGASGDVDDLRVSLHSAEGDLNASPIDVTAPAYGLPTDGDLYLGIHAKGPIYLALSNVSPGGLITPVQLCVAAEPCDPGCGNASLAGFALFVWPLGRRRARGPA